MIQLTFSFIVLKLLNGLKSILDLVIFELKEGLWSWVDSYFLSTFSMSRPLGNSSTSLSM